jgi:hypothetical protein
MCLSIRLGKDVRRKSCRARSTSATQRERILPVERTSYGWGVEEGVPASLRQAGLTLAPRATPSNADVQAANVNDDFRTSLATNLRRWSAEIRREQAWMRLLGNNFVSLWEYAYKAYPLPTRYHRWRRVRFLMRATIWWHSTIGCSPVVAPCVYRKFKLGRSGDEVRPGWRVT